MPALRQLVGRAWRARIRRVPLTSFERAFRAVEPHTMLGLRRLARLHRGVRDVVRRGVPGDVVECGVARGGSAALMALALSEESSDRRLWLFDSFEGMPEPSREHDPDHEAARRFVGLCKGDPLEVERLVLGVRPGQPLAIVRGLYQETLRDPPCGPIALLHVDCDWYESVRTCLEALHDRVSPGGIVQIDDYNAWEGCRRAVDEFFRGPRATRLHRIDASAVWLRKP